MTHLRSRKGPRLRTPLGAGQEQDQVSSTPKACGVVLISSTLEACNPLRIRFSSTSRYLAAAEREDDQAKAASIWGDREVKDREVKVYVDPLEGLDE